MLMLPMRVLMGVFDNRFDTGRVAAQGSHQAFECEDALDIAVPSTPHLVLS